VRRFIQDSVRPDGRGLSVCRPVSVAKRAVSSADGSAMAKLGPSTVLANVHLEVMVPSSEAPAHGQVRVLHHAGAGCCTTLSCVLRP
jgi:exosome complex component RRP43